MDNEFVFDKEEGSALIYHIPLSKDGLRIRIASLSEKNGKLNVDESMVDIPFGDGIILDSK